MGCTQLDDAPTTAPTENDAPEMIYLYGELHSRPYIVELELQLWQNYYHEYGMRHLFLEDCYFTAQILNLWMQAEDDTLLDLIFAAIKGTHGGSEVKRNFYKSIKETCPETVFHGTDVGHQYDSLGTWYLSYLQEHGLTDSQEYQLTEEAIAQGRAFYHEAKDADVYRENMMAENFIREFDSLTGESVMGIYGNAHTGLYALNKTKECDCMGKQLKARYGETITSEDLYERALLEAKPKHTETIVVNDKSYTAAYYGLTEVNASSPEYHSMEFWHLFGAYEDFYNYGTNTGNTMAQYNFPMLLQTGEAYLIRFNHADGNFHWEYYICTGRYSKGKLYTLEVKFN